jgi:predicted PurR-regulated permease PerM
LQILARLGISQAQLDAFSRSVADQLASVAGNLAKDIVPLVTGVAGALVNVLLTGVVSIYLLVDGERAVAWVRGNTPLPVRNGMAVLLEILQRVVGGYVRGQFVLCVIVGFLVGIGMFSINVPYAVLLGTLGGFLEFIPVLGTIASGIICCLLALTQGWLTFVLALVYFVVLHVVEGYVLAPRVVGKAVGLHPVVSLLALTAGGELFGPLGAILAAPVAGLMQSILISFWLYYRQTHREQFVGVEHDVQAEEPTT